MYRINSTWTSFDIDLENLKQVLLKNQYPLTMIDNVIKKYLQNDVNKTNAGSMAVEMPNIETRYFKLPFIGMYSKVTQNKIEKLCKRFCKSAKVKLVFIYLLFALAYRCIERHIPPLIPSSTIKSMS